MSSRLIKPGGAEGLIDPTAGPVKPGQLMLGYGPLALANNFTWAIDNVWHDVTGWTARSITPPCRIWLFQILKAFLIMPNNGQWAGAMLLRTAPSAITCDSDYAITPAAWYGESMYCYFGEVLEAGTTYTYKAQASGYFGAGTATVDKTISNWWWIPSALP